MPKGTLQTEINSRRKTATAGSGGSVVSTSTPIVLAAPSGLTNSGGLALSDTIAGNGLTISSKVLEVGQGDGITVDTDSISVDLSSTSGLEFSSGELQIADSIAGDGLAINNKVLSVGEGTGLTVSANDVAVDTTYAFTWTGAHTFQATMTTRAMYPELTDAYDIGSVTALYRKAFISEIDALIFAENTISTVGGAMQIGPGQGTFAADVGNADTTVDFGQAMTPNDFVEVRAIGQVEYMQVGALDSGTVYNVTRNLDGSGANDWPAGTVYVINGYGDGAGGYVDGRILLSAISTPRIDILLQGDTYNDTQTVVRIGDMNGAFGIASEAYGFGVGDYSGGDYLVYNPSSGFEIHAGGNAVAMTGSGIAITPEEDFQDYTAYRFIDIGGLYGRAAASETYVQVRASLVSGKDSEAVVSASCEQDHQATSRLSATSGDYELDMYMRSDYDASTYEIAVGYWDLGEGSPSFHEMLNLAPVDGDITYHGDLTPYRNSTTYTAYAYVPLATPLTSTSWDGDSKTTGNNGTIDLSAVFGAPAGIKAISVYMLFRDETTNVYCGLRPTSGTINIVEQYTQVAGQYVGIAGVVPCDTNGDVYWYTGDELDNVIIRISGYWI